MQIITQMILCNCYLINIIIFKKSVMCAMMLKKYFATEQNIIQRIIYQILDI